MKPLAALVLLALAIAVPATAAQAPTGNAKGLALLAKIERAYRHVPAVKLFGKTSNVDARFVIVLRHGIGVAESFSAIAPQGSERLVTHNGATYELRVGTTCWRKLSARNRSSLEDVGIRFPLSRRTRVGAPKLTAGAWQLPVHMEGTFKGEGGNAIFVVDPHTFRIRANIDRTNGANTVEHVVALKRAPKLPRPTPLC
jgi:hypothetical protein